MCVNAADTWNRFDFGVVSLTMVGLIITWSGTSGIGSLASVVRLIRVGRCAGAVAGGRLTRWWLGMCVFVSVCVCVCVCVCVFVCATRRLLRLVRTAKSLRIMFNTLLVTLPSVFNIGALLGLVYFIFSILAMQNFALTKYGGFPWSVLSVDVNFRTFWLSFIVLVCAARGPPLNQSV
jgi:Ion transport protein